MNTCGLSASHESKENLDHRISVLRSNLHPMKTHLHLEVPSHFFLFSFHFFFFCLFRATLVAYGGAQARGQIGATAVGLPHSHSNGGSVTYTTAHSNARSLIHWARPGIKPLSSWILVGFVITEPWWELPHKDFLAPSCWKHRPSHSFVITLPFSIKLLTVWF